MTTSTTVNRRIELGRATRATILETATSLFAEYGYEATPIETILERSRVSRGSLYHHFASKPALFEAVLEEQERRVAERTVAAAAGIADPLEGLRAGCHAWLKMANEQVVRQIVLVDAPAVVGWERWREIDARHAFGILKGAVAAIVRDTARFPTEAVSHLVLAALIETALLISRAKRPRKALQEGLDAIDRVLDGLLSPEALRRSCA